jgi:hypothetical protein
MDENIDSLIQYIAKHFVFNEKEYPELRGASDDEVLRFAIRHSALHFAKTAGKIATASEDIDHGKEIDIKAIKTDITKSLINTLRLAELFKMSGSELTALIKKSTKNLRGHKDK